MTNKKVSICNTTTVMKVLSTKLKNNKHLLNAWCQWISHVKSYIMWNVLLFHANKMIELEKDKKNNGN